MTKEKFLKVFGFLGTISAAVVTGIGGDVVTAVGLVTAALSSAGIFAEDRDV